MKKTQLKKCLDEMFSAVEQKYGKKKYEVMEMSAKTCITKEGELFLHMEATLSSNKPTDPSYAVSKDFDL